MWFYGANARPLIQWSTSYSQLIHWLLKRIQGAFSSSFDEVCSRCSGGRVGTEDREDVRVDGFPLCVVPPVGAVAPFHGTTVATLKLLEGYFRTSNESHNVLRCYHGAACRGGRGKSGYCAHGYMGPCEKPLVIGNWLLGCALEKPALNNSVVVKSRHTEQSIIPGPGGSPCQMLSNYCPELITFPVSMVPFQRNVWRCFLWIDMATYCTTSFLPVFHVQPALQTVRFVRKGLRQGLPTAVVNALGVSRYRRWRLWRRSLSP